MKHNRIILYHFRLICFSMLLNIIWVFSACNNPMEPDPDIPFDTEIAYNYVIKVGKDKEYKHPCGTAKLTSIPQIAGALQRSE